MYTITDMQARMAQAALHWTISDTAAVTGLHYNTVAAAMAGRAGEKTMRRLQQAFEANKVEFFPDGGVLPPERIGPMFLLPDPR